MGACVEAVKEYTNLGADIRAHCHYLKKRLDFLKPIMLCQKSLSSV